MKSFTKLAIAVLCSLLLTVVMPLQAAEPPTGSPEKSSKSGKSEKSEKSKKSGKSAKNNRSSASSWNGLRANPNNSSFVNSEITADAIRERGLRILWKHDQRTVVTAHPSYDFIPGLFESRCANPSGTAANQCLRKTAVDIPPAVHAGSGKRGDDSVVYVTSYKWIDPILKDVSYLLPGNAVTPFGTVGKNVGHGELQALDADTGSVIWKRSLSDYSDTSGCDAAAKIGGQTNPDNCRLIEFSRSTPVMDGDLLYIGTYTSSTSSQGAESYEGFLQRRSHIDATELGTGGFMLAINRHSGDLVWAKRLSNSVSSSTVNATSVHDGVVFVGLVQLSYSSNWIDFLGVQGDVPNYVVPVQKFDSDFEHDVAHGALLALDARTGKVLWKIYHTPPRPEDLATDETWYAGASSGYAGALAIQPGSNGANLYVSTSNNSTVPRVDMLCEKQRRVALSFEEQDQLDKLLDERAEQFGDDVSCDANKPGATQLNDAFDRSVTIEEDGSGNSYKAYSFGNMADSIYSLKLNPSNKNPRLEWVYHANVYDRFNELCSLARPEVLRAAADDLVGASVVPIGRAQIFENIDDQGVVQECAGNDSLNGTDAIRFLDEPLGVANADFAVGPVLTEDADGEPVIVALNKNGLLYFIDPDNGELISTTRQGPYSFAAAFGLVVDENKVYSNVSMANNRFTILPFPYGNDWTPRVSLQLCHEFGVRFSLPSSVSGCSVPVDSALSGTSIDETIGSFVNAISIEDERSLWMSPDPSGGLSLAGVVRLPFLEVAGLIDIDIDVSGQGLSFATPLPDNNGSPYLRSNYGGHMTGTEDVVFVGSTSSDARLGMHALDSATGEIIWIFPRALFELNGEYLPALVASAPAIVGNRLYWGTGQHGLFLPGVGVESGSGPESPPISGEGGIFFAFELCPEGTRATADFQACAVAP